ncbi:MAG TPA: potassium transporter TrkG [Actinophytocola sp.]|uniref:TrkH family potassium uptake protein n=1 Tax=Actinophytocola sp. TaxID=1872138 RepID=UPI002DDD40BA|nr:potassium transporter TrkG [Actinophytocola sp.]HEV2783467.1 potassium transporter TrkG [Actinophytocola sp.]
MIARRTWRRPARLVVVAFGLVTLGGTGLLMLPVSAESGHGTGFVTALFTATGAICGGLASVDTGSHWTVFGELVVLALIQVGGLGIMTLASLLVLLMSRRLGMRMQLTAAAETSSVGVGDLRRVLAGVVVASFLIEAVTAAVLIARFATSYGMPFGRAVYHGVFHSISAFNNAGFGLYRDNLIGFATDPIVMVPVMVAMIAGGLGFPVLLEIARRLRRKPMHWSIHTKITIGVYLGLTVVGGLAIVGLEWAQPGTLGPMGVGDKLMVGTFHSVTPRTAGFNSLDVGQLQPATLLVTDILMFIGAGSASTAGGIKVTTFALLAFVMLAEVRGEPTVHVLGRRLPATVQRQALTVALLGVGVVIAGTLGVLVLTELPLDVVLFEACSAFGTVGLSTGITGQLPAAGQLILVALMLIGRLGPITVASALALRERPRRYELPEERPVVG